MGCTMFESVSLISALKMGYVVFPTIKSAQTIARVRYNLTFISLDAKWNLQFEWKTEN